MFRAHFVRLVLFLPFAWLAVNCAHGTGLTWPAGQLLPTFSTPATNIDCIDISSASGAEQDLFASLEGIVNRTQPRIACVSSSEEEGEFTWLTIHNLPYHLTNGYGTILKYETNITGLVVDDPNQPDTLNLATTIAGLNNELICDPSLLNTLTNAPYALAVKDDLRGRFSTKYQVYNYLYTNCWPLCTHRIFAGMETNGHGALRDYLVAVKSGVVWLDPGSSADATALAPFISSMTPAAGVYMGWWPNEANGLQWIAQYGIPVVASDWYDNGSLFSGAVTPVAIPPIPPAPALQNKVYVAVTLSDGDNVQYMQHHLKNNWGNSARGSVPIGWTTQPLAADLDPGMLNYYWSTASTNDCLVAGPSGAGYTRINYWSTANLGAYTKISNPYLQRSGIRTITVWLNVSSATGYSFATNCPTLVGLYDQNGGVYATSYHSLPVIGLPGNDNYTSTEQMLFSGITNATAGWNGSAPMFLSVEGSGWDISPADCQTLKNSLNSSEYVLVRPDHLFLLYRQWAGLGVAAAAPYIAVPPASQSANVGTNITFNVIASGSAPLIVQWRFNGTNITGATNTFYVKSSVQPADAGNYSVLVTNTAGTAISSTATLTVTSYTPASPRAMTLPPALITSSLATLNGAVLANGTNTVAWFEWGTNASYGRQTPVTNSGNSFQVAPINTVLNSLAASAIYHFRLDASNALGTALGADELFTTGGRAKAWGDNSFGQTNVPAGLTNVVAVTSSAYDAVALKNDGTIAAWGFNYYGLDNVPTNVTNVIAVASGFHHSLALRADGTLVAWGANDFGQLNGVSNVNNVAGIAAGAYHSIVVKRDGTVAAWGDNSNGQTNVPAGLINATAVAAGINHSLALCADGTVTAWGANVYGQTNVPAGLSNVVAIASGENHCLALKSDGTVAAWGWNNDGQTTIPANLTNVAAIACGDYFSLALKTDGTVVSWGDNGSGQRNLPAGLTNIVQFAGGMEFSLAIGNLAPQAISQVASGYVNHDLTILLDASPGDGPALNYRITTMPGAGMLYQYTNGSRGNIVSPAAPQVADSNGRVIFASGTNASGNPYDNFNFVANDGLNDSPPALVTVNIGLPVPPQFQQTLWSSGAAGVFGLGFQGSSNATYSIWGSTNLQVWNWLGPTIETLPGYYQYTDTSASNWPARFYRVTAP